MADEYIVTNTELSDLELVFTLFDHSIRYQRAHGYPSWENYDKDAIIRDIQNRNQYKVVIGSKTAIVFSVSYSDKVIWREFDQGDAIYLHRIVVNPEFKGQRLFGYIVDWALQHILRKGLKHVRMDTWASNSTIIGYYQRFGFQVVETYTTPDSPELPVHNRNLALTLLEYRPRTSTI